MKAILVVLLSFTIPTPVLAQDPQWGKFIGTVKTEWLDDGRKMQLLDGFSFVDPLGASWDAKKGVVVDGASIPKVFWSFIGGPFEGKYRNASVVHDVACEERTRSWRVVHQMFYVASLRGGVGEVAAKVMYGAVYHFGPRWAQFPARTLVDDADFLRMREYIRKNSAISLEGIEKLTRNFLRDVVKEIPPPTRISADELR
jgi:hypothetical protein